jgi:hypothetical protein
MASLRPALQPRHWRTTRRDNEGVAWRKKKERATLVALGAGNSVEGKAEGRAAWRASASP